MNEADMEEKYIRRQANYLPWEERSEEIEAEHVAYQNILRRRAGATHFGRNCFVSPDAHIYTSKFEIGSNSWVAAGVIIRGHVIIGDNTSINPYAHIAGNVRIGSGVRIAGMASIYGFNHGFSDTTVPIYTQQHTMHGVIVEDDVWIGANSVIVDGVKVAAHSIVSGGAVVTKTFPEYSIIGGNPARILKSRL